MGTWAGLLLLSMLSAEGLCVYSGGHYNDNSSFDKMPPPPQLGLAPFPVLFGKKTKKKWDEITPKNFGTGVADFIHLTSTMQWLYIQNMRYNWFSHIKSHRSFPLCRLKVWELGTFGAHIGTTSWRLPRFWDPIWTWWRSSPWPRKALKCMLYFTGARLVVQF